jgi:hypothetical protein
MRLMDNKPKQRSLASLTVYSRTPSLGELEQLVPISADWSKEKGTQRGRQPGNVHPHNVVVFESHLDRAAGLSAHVDDVLGRLDPAKDALRSFAQRARSEGFQSASGRPFAPVVFWLRAESAEDTIGFDISNDQLKAICDLGAVLAVELETYGKDDGDLSDAAGGEN